METCIWLRSWVVGIFLREILRKTHELLLHGSKLLNYLNCVNYFNNFKESSFTSCSKALSEPTQIFKMEFFRKITHYFRKKLLSKCLTMFWIHLWCYIKISYFELKNRMASKLEQEGVFLWCFKNKCIRRNTSCMANIPKSFLISD